MPSGVSTHSTPSSAMPGALRRSRRLNAPSTTSPTVRTKTPISLVLPVRSLIPHHPASTPALKAVLPLSDWCNRYTLQSLMKNTLIPVLLHLFLIVACSSFPDFRKCLHFFGWQHAARKNQ